MKTLRIVFVCSGNICRSPMAAGFARAKLQERDVPALVVSCGTLGIVGRPAAQLGQVAMEERGVDISDHYSQGVQLAMLDVADWVVVMAPAHHAMLLKYAPHLDERIAAMWEWADDDLEQIADPVGGDLEAFRSCRDLLETCVDNWLDHVLQSD